MHNPWLRRTTGILLILVPLVFTICFTLLQIRFEYPDILRQPTAEVLRKFQAGGQSLIAIWYVLMLTAVLFIPIAVLVRRLLQFEGAETVLGLAATFGVAAGLVQTLGFIRWPFVVPHLAEIYMSATATDMERISAGIIFEAFHWYAGVAIGEQLGYLFTSLWTFMIATVLLRSTRTAWLGWSGMVLAVGIGLGLLEMAGWEAAGAINAISYLLWAVWLILFGVMVLLRRDKAPLGNQPALAAALPA